MEKELESARPKIRDCHLGRLDRPVRIDLLALLKESGLPPGKVWRRFTRRSDYPLDEGDLDRLLDTVRDRWGRKIEDAFELATEEHKAPIPELQELPDQDFALAVECGIEILPDLTADGDKRFITAVRRINNRLIEGDVPLRFNEKNGRAEWLDIATHELLFRPTLRALEDPRLDGARQEFEAAYADLQRGGPKALEDAIDEAAKSVESAMIAVLEAGKVALPIPPTASSLVKTLEGSEITEKYLTHLLLAASSIRNNMAAHGSGSSRRLVAVDLAQAAVSAAAAAVGLLSSKLP